MSPYRTSFGTGTSPFCPCPSVTLDLDNRTIARKAKKEEKNERKSQKLHTFNLEVEDLTNESLTNFSPIIDLEVKFEELTVEILAYFSETKKGGLERERN